MRLLLDTQLAIWWQIRPASINANVEQKIRSAEAVFVSRASLWEMAIKIGLGKLNIDLSLFASHLEATGFQWLDIKTDHIVQLSQLPTYEDHKDPFDRLLIAQSRSEPVIFLTANTKLERYGNLVQVA